MKAYRPEENSIGSGQVLKCPYTAKKARLVVREMADSLALSLVDKELVTDQIVLTVGYDIENLSRPEIVGEYKGEVTTDRYGRRIPKHAHGTENLNRRTSSARLITDAAVRLYDRIVDEKLLIRRLNLTAAHVTDEKSEVQACEYEQLNMFTDYAAMEKKEEEERQALEREKRMQQAMLDIKRKFGKNAILKGMNLEEGATTIERNKQIGGHKA